MITDPTRCEYDGTAQAYHCVRDEQCDDCFMVDHLKDCAGCEQYDHPPMIEARKLPVQHDTGTRVHTPEGWTEMGESIVEKIADHEQRWGEERSATE